MKTSIRMSVLGGVLGGLMIMATACGKPMHSIPEKQLVKRAPMSESETGVIVSGPSKNEIGLLASQNPDLSVRVVSQRHNLYEIHGSSEAELKNLIATPNAIIEKNHYVSLRDFKKAGKEEFKEQAKAAPERVHPFVRAIEENQGVQLEGELKDFVSSCKLNRFTAPALVIDSSQPLDRTESSILLELGQDLTLSAENSKAKGLAKDLQFLWLVTPAEDSMLPPTASFSPTFEITPDTTGIYVFSTIAKDSVGFCQLSIRGFFVTANLPFQPEKVLDDSQSAKINPKIFWHVFHVGAQATWAKATGEGQVIAIIDTGVDYNHPALAANILVNEKEIAGNGIDDDGNDAVDDVTGYDFGLQDGFPYDDFGHGTHCAGIAASNVFGAARKAKILPVKFGAGVGFDIASVTGSIKYSVDRGATVLSMSFGWDDDYKVMREAMAYAEERNVLAVVASGNDRKNNDNHPSYPASYLNKNILTVAATDENDQLTDYSNYGESVHIAAPGGTDALPIISSYKKNPYGAEYVGFTGTSMAAPLVAGVAAQTWSAKPSLTAVELRQVLIETGKESEGLKDKILSGRVIDAAAAVDKVLPPAAGLQ